MEVKEEDKIYLLIVYWHWMLKPGNSNGILIYTLLSLGMGSSCTTSIGYN